MNEESIANSMVKAEAKRLGFDVCGLAHAEPVDKHTGSFFSSWLNEKKNADMDYLANYHDKRFDPQVLVEGTQTIVSVALNYYPAQFIPPTEYQIAWYAYGKDYHEVVKQRLQKLLAELQIKYPSLTGRAFCDTAPVFERYWAWKAGLGWIGKNCMDAGIQLTHFKRLHHIIVSPRIKTFYFIIGRTKCGKHNNRISFISRFYTFTDFQSIDIRQYNICQHQVKVLFLSFF